MAVACRNHYSVSVKNELEVPIKGLGLPHIMCKCQHYLVVLRGLPYSSLFTSAKYLAKNEKVCQWEEHFLKKCASIFV